MAHQGGYCTDTGGAVPCLDACGPGRMRGGYRDENEVASLFRNAGSVGSGLSAPAPLPVLGPGQGWNERGHGMAVDCIQRMLWRTLWRVQPCQVRCSCSSARGPCIGWRSMRGVWSPVTCEVQHRPVLLRTYPPWRNIQVLPRPQSFLPSFGGLTEHVCAQETMHVLHVLRDCTWC